MWWKKLLYSLLIIFLGFGITVISGSINFNTQSKTLIKRYSKQKDYEMVERFFCYVTTDPNSYFVSKDYQDIHYDVYPCLVKHPYYKYYVDEGHVVVYDVVEEAIGFTFFSLPKSFSLKDKNNNKGQVKLTLSDERTISLHFDNKDKEDGEMNYYIDFYSFSSQYYSLSVYITRHDYFAIENIDNVSITKMELIDGNNVSYFEELLTSKPVNFNHQLFVDYKTSTDNYYDFMMEYGYTISEGAFRERKRLLNEIDKVTENNAVYHAKPSKMIILSTNSFILTISLTIAIYTSIAIVITRLIFYRKKNYY